MDWMRGGELFAVVVGLAIWASVVWASATVLKKAGFSGWWSIIAIIPIANWVALMVFASSEWPALRRPSDGGA